MSHARHTRDSALYEVVAEHRGEAAPPLTLKAGRPAR